MTNEPIFFEEEFADRRLDIPGVNGLSDVDLKRLNKMLPWNSYVLDRQGRRFGAPTSATKRNTPQKIPDRRITLLNQRIPLSEATVLEIGCFEGIHTIGLARLARQVKACDSRIEHIAKTAVRCAMFQVHATLFLWNVEEPLPSGQSVDCDVLFHMGVLYHLLDPVRHLANIASQAKRGLLLDTHYAKPEEADDTYSVGGRAYRCKLFKEGTRSGPFAGMNPTSRWLLLADIVELLREAGFNSVDWSRIAPNATGRAS